ncbi:uncharacterized protein LOC128390060 isoform X1 [Panonychus citri]|uniref:uncharacterized protein LOC128390060 isoform X1 n=1 Tax=Panonychus citri TaxID=50023 RepID=UPI00230791FD|nr:uncharacterized protein LOC128390060 isoform X1 [Panonychus citri]
MFHIEKLPDDCLSSIFESITNLDDLIVCSKVCQRWRFLIVQRLNKVKYLSDDSSIGCFKNSIYFNKLDSLSQSQLLGLLPRFKILDIRPTNETKFKSIDIFKVIEGIKSVKGLIYEPCWDKFPCSISRVLTMNLEQLYFADCFQNHFEEIANSGYLKNLQRLHIGSRNFSISSYDGPVLESIKILEACLYSYDATNPYPGFHFMDLCPSVESAHHLIKPKKLSINQTIKNNSLRNLVLDHPENYVSDNWTDLRNLLIKYPKLKNLAIRGDYGLDDSNLTELLDLIPEIVILDLRQSTRLSEKSKDIVNRYCQRKNREIWFYNRPDQRIEHDWPELASQTNQRICQGFDFMRNCFLKTFQQLPYLIDPIEDD